MCCLYTAISIGFEEQQYTFRESDRCVNDTVFATKGDVVSEQNLTLLVQFSEFDAALEGK